MAAQGARVIGIDMASRAWLAAQAHAVGRDLTLGYHQGTAEAWAMIDPLVL